jgi:ABC-type uncharacterized transport system substrate-binding protein
LAASLASPEDQFFAKQSLNKQGHLVPRFTAISRDGKTNPNLENHLGEIGLQLHVLHSSTERDFDTVFATLHQLQVRALVIGPDALFISRSEQLGALTVRHAVPAITLYREFAAAGGLMSYGGSANDADRRAGIYTGRVLKGERPADLPVQQDRASAIRPLPCWER